MPKFVVFFVVLSLASCAKSSPTENSNNYQKPKPIIVQHGNMTDEQAKGVRQVLAIQCEHGGGSYCADLSKMYEDGIGGESNLNEAIRLTKRACELGYKPSCDKLR